MKDISGRRYLRSLFGTIVACLLAACTATPLPTPGRTATPTLTIAPSTAPTPVPSATATQPPTTTPRLTPSPTLPPAPSLAPPTIAPSPTVPPQLPSVQGTWRKLPKVRGTGSRGYWWPWYTTAVELPEGGIAILGGGWEGGAGRFAPGALVYDPRGSTVGNLPDLPLGGNAPAAAALADGTILLFGDRTWALGPSRRAWVELAAPPAADKSCLGAYDYPYRAFATRGADGLVYVGGWCGARPGRGDDIVDTDMRIDVYDPARDRWLEPMGRPGGAAVALIGAPENRIFLLTQASYNSPIIDLWTHSLDDRTWAAGPALVVDGRANLVAAAALPDGRLVLLLEPGSVAVFDVERDEWAEGPSAPGLPLDDPGLEIMSLEPGLAFAASLGRRIYVFNVRADGLSWSDWSLELER